MPGAKEIDDHGRVVARCADALELSDRAEHEVSERHGHGLPGGHDERAEGGILDRCVRRDPPDRGGVVRIAQIRRPIQVDAGAAPRANR